MWNHTGDGGNWEQKSSKEGTEGRREGEWMRKGRLAEERQRWRRCWREEGKRRQEMEGKSSPAPLFSLSCGERRHCGPGSSAPLVFASTGGALSPGLSGARGSGKEAWGGSVSLEVLAASGALQAGERGSSGPLLALGRPPSSPLALRVGRSLLPFAHLQASCLPFFPLFSS